MHQHRPHTPRPVPGQSFPGGPATSGQSGGTRPGSAQTRQQPDPRFTRPVSPGRPQAPRQRPPGGTFGTPPRGRPGIPAQRREEPTTVAPAPADPGPTTKAETTAVAKEKKKPDLTVNKVIAGAGAAATSAILGSYFGATGTVTGAAFGSVISTVVSTVYQRSLDRTKELALRKIRLPDGKVTEAAVVDEPIDPQATVLLQARTADGRPLTAPGDTAAESTGGWRAGLTRGRVLVGIGATVLTFVVGLLVITGIEWAKGSPISGGDSGTSVGRVVQGSAAGGSETRTSTPHTSTAPTTTENEDSGASRSPSATRTTTPEERAPRPTQQDGSGGTGYGSGGEPTGRQTVTPTLTANPRTAPNGAGQGGPAGG